MNTNEMIIKIDHADKNATEQGYGLYINCHIKHVDEIGNKSDGLIFASDCLPKDASESDIKKSERNVRRRAIRAFKKFYS